MSFAAKKNDDGWRHFHTSPLCACFPTRTMPGVEVKDKYLCDALAIDEGQHGLYLALAMSVDQSLSVYDAMKRALQPDGSCSQGQFFFISLNSYIHS